MPSDARKTAAIAAAMASLLLFAAMAGSSTDPNAVSRVNWVRYTRDRPAICPSVAECRATVASGSPQPVACYLPACLPEPDAVELGVNIWVYEPGEGSVVPAVAGPYSNFSSECNSSAVRAVSEGSFCALAQECSAGMADLDGALVTGVLSHIATALSVALRVRDKNNGSVNRLLCIFGCFVGLVTMAIPIGEFRRRCVTAEMPPEMQWTTANGTALVLVALALALDLVATLASYSAPADEAAGKYAGTPLKFCCGGDDGDAPPPSVDPTPLTVIPGKAARRSSLV